MNNNPLNTIFKSKNKNKLKTILGKQIGTFSNNKINKIHARYQTVFSQIMSIFNESIFYRNVFLPRMDKRTKFMKINNKILGKKVEPLTKRYYDFISKKLETSRTYEQYINNKEIPLFTYITNDPDQFENWSAIRIFEWWRDLRMSRIPKEKWPVFDAVKYLFINQFMRIMNSYLKYGVDRSDKFPFGELQEYLRLVDVFYKNEGQYKYLLNAHLAFCEWFSARFIGGLLFESGRNNNKEYVSSSIYSNQKNSGSILAINLAVSTIQNFFKKTLEDNNGILVIPVSFFQKESKFINTYTAPLIVFLGVNYRTHINSYSFQDDYSPFHQIIHDFIVHSKSCKSSYNQLYIRTTYDDIKLFEQRCKFLTIISSIDNDYSKKLLWLILHEISFFERAIVDIVNTINIESNTFFDFNILFERLNDVQIQALLKKYLIIEPEDSEKLKLDAIYTLICACIVFFMSNFLPLEYFQNLKIFVEESIIIINNPNNISFNKIIKILRDDNILIEFTYDIKTKQLQLLYLSDYKLLRGIIQLQLKGISLIHNTSCFESYLLSQNTIKACEILSGCLFFNNEFLPKMRDRIDKKRVIMRVNKKFNKLSEANYQTKQSELGMKTNSFNKYQERYDTPLFTYITNDPDQFENWSAIRIFEWWCNLRMSGTQLSTFQTIIPKRKWPIFDAVKYLFINQILHILNSYRKYGISDGSHWAFNRLHEYLQLVDSFYKSEGKGQYQYLLDAHLAFCDWFSVRFIGGLLFERRKGNYVNSREYTNFSSYNDVFIKIFKNSLIDKNYILFIPLSIIQKESKFINIYSSPIISYLGINYRTHENTYMYYLHYSPIHQITHDIYVHARQIIENYSSLYPTENYNDVALFAKRCKFLTIVSFINNENAIILLFNILHEINYFKEPSNNFFNLDILFNKLNDNKKIYDTILEYVNKSILDNGINPLICACIIFFMCNFLLLNDIQRIAITINDLIVSVSYDSIELIRFEIKTNYKQIVLLYVNPDIDKRYIQSLNYITRFGYSIVNLEQNKINKLSRNIRNLLAKLNEQKTTTLMKKYINKLKQSQP
jgi:hypothetical protein